MAIPDFQKLMLPLVEMTEDGHPHTLGEAVEHAAAVFSLAAADRAELLSSGQTRLYNRVGWATTYLRKAGVLRAVGPGRFELTERGRELLASKPNVLDVALLESRYPEMSEFSKARPQADTDEPAATFNASSGTWSHRAGVEVRIREKFEAAIPATETRTGALKFLAFAIENADEERGDAWYVRETDRGLRLMTGRLLACAIRAQRMRVSVVGPISDEVREAIGADSQSDDEFEFKQIPGAILISFSIDHAERALGLLKDALASFIDLAMGRVRSAVTFEYHAPEAIAYVAGAVGRDLPQPQPIVRSAEESDEASADDDEDEVSREPRVRGRAPIFEHGQRSIASLMSDIEREVIALPDLQRPFVWEDTKVRDLLDSLFLGFPVGTLVLWHTANEREARALGVERPSLRATTLVIDGQQRLTSLYAVMRGVEVAGKKGESRKIAIAFRPRDGKFEVADAAIRRDPEYLSDVTELWSGRRPKPQIRRELLTALRDKGRVLNEAYEDAVERNLDRAHSIGDYRFPTVDIRKTAGSQDEEATEEDVAEIFVRINNQGARLGQADFVLTLLSVFHGDLRDLIEDRARAMSANSVVSIDAQQLLRATCAVAFGRARMSAVYRYLRGVDPTTGEADAEERLQRLRQLDDAARECTEPTPWRDFLLRIRHAGFVSPALIASKNAVVNAYAFYVRGRTAHVPKDKLDAVASRWLFGTLLTARYSSSSETVFEQDLARVDRTVATEGGGVVEALDAAMHETITGDYWTHSVVAALETQKARAPTALAFRAAQVVLGVRALFSDQLLQNLLDPPAQGGRAASEAHHLFPEAWLRARGTRDRRLINQVANLADIGWHENNVIGGRGPADYVPRLRERLGIDDDTWRRQCAEHALPPGWESLSYDDFLAARRIRMADLIRVAYRKLGGEADEPPVAPPWFLPGTEIVWQRIAEVEKGLRAVVKEVYGQRFGSAAGERLEAALSTKDRDALLRALRTRPSGSDPLTVVDYMYLGSLPALLFADDVWQDARKQLTETPDIKRRLNSALEQIVPIRNEIAHVREVGADRLLRATVASSDALALIRRG